MVPIRSAMVVLWLLFGWWSAVRPRIGASVGFVACTRLSSSMCSLPTAVPWAGFVRLIAPMRSIGLSGAVWRMSRTSVCCPTGMTEMRSMMFGD